MNGNPPEPIHGGLAQGQVVAALLASLALAACARTPPAAPHGEPAAEPPAAASPTRDARSAPAATGGSATPRQGGERAPEASLPEPGPAAINTPQAAATAVETYFALLAAGRTAQADAAWGSADDAATFRREFAALGDYSVQVDAPGAIGAAAGSMYVTVPVRFLPAPSVSNPRPRMGEAVVRRVNDVPGSTDAQRRWHIERIDVAMTPK